MSCKNPSQFSAKFSTPIWAFLAAAVLFCGACTSRNPVNSSETPKEPKPNQNQNPRVTSVMADPASLSPGQQAAITVAAYDPDNDTLSYSYSATGGTISGSEPYTTFVAGSAGTGYVTVTVEDGRGGISGSYVVIPIR